MVAQWYLESCQLCHSCLSVDLVISRQALRLQSPRSKLKVEAAQSNFQARNYVLVEVRLEGIYSFFPLTPSTKWIHPKEFRSPTLAASTFIH